MRAQDWHDKPDRPAQRRGRHPHISAMDPKVRTKALHCRTDFLTAHREALKEFNRRPVRKGTVVFPCGTWLMRTRHNVRCHPPPDTS